MSRAASLLGNQAAKAAAWARRAIDNGSDTALAVKVMFTAVGEFSCCLKFRDGDEDSHVRFTLQELADGSVNGNS